MEKPGLYPDGRTIGWIAAGGITSALFFLSSVYIPLIGSLLGILAPIPIITIYMRRGWSGGALASLVASLFVGFTIKPVVALYFLAQFAMLGLAASYLIEKRASFGVVMLLSSLLVAAGFFLLIEVQAFITNQGFFEALKKPLQENIQTVFKSYPGLYGKEAKDAAKMLQYMLSLLVVLVPALIVIGSWVILLVNLYIIDRMHFLPGRNLLRTFDLNVWRAPEHFIWLVIIPGFAVFFLHTSLRVIALNVLVASLAVYFFQGLCVINFYFARKNAPPFLKVLAYFVIFVIQIVAVIVVIMGLLDMWLDFRKLLREPKVPPPSDETHP